ncbi:Serine/threonine-protein kinase plo1 [Cyphellophora attinorum]|uniref:Serine/threonine-protein kinase plo1 n=1 Tax=Cyphellophora attinorum TaxID=1664694 RepID=A0A0N0NRI7_9EURO|nr:Serine/threonine-protein kinase plo1 [Phialophora attinorum]KPI45128.1 Serine/threonine-protein kinase plo1 [Phialophora attinorum]
MEVLSPRSANVPPNPRPEKMKKASRPKQEEKVTVKPVPSKQVNPDRIDEKWRPPASVSEPAPGTETYIPGKKLGKGGFAVCFEGQSTKTGKIFALKVVKAKVEQKKMMEKFRTELQIHAKMNHPNIVDFLRAFTLDDHTYVVLELCSNGNLTDMVRARSCLSLPEVRRFLIQICGGVRYMHKRSVIHRDLKMGNVFLDEHMNIRIGDFGLAAVMVDAQDRRTTLCGTPNYIAPEILSKSGARGHDNKVDTWAIGVIAYAMLVGTPPFQSKTQQEIYTKLRALEYEWKIDCKNYIPQQAKDFVAACLNLDSAERPEMDDLVEHDFFKMGVVAEPLTTSCLKHKPDWLLSADPRGDKVQPGYGLNYSQLCRAAGVGRRADGSSRVGVGGKHTMSTLVEIEAENQLGSAPTVPLPEGILYSAITEAQAEQARQQQHSGLPMRVRGRKLLLGDMERIPEESNASSKPATMTVPGRAAAPVPSFAATQRQQALPSRQRTAPVEPARAASDDNPQTSEGLLRARPMRAASVRTTRSTTATSQTTRALPKSSTLPTALDVVAAEAPERPSSRAATIGRSDRLPAPASRSLKLASRGDNATTRPASVMARFSDDIPTVSKTDTTVNVQQKHSDDSGASKTSASKLSPDARETKRALISPNEPFTLVDNTANRLVLSALQDLHDVLNPRQIETCQPRQAVGD